MCKVMVGPGDKVAPGDPLIVMIAMKMEYVIKVISRSIKSPVLRIRDVYPGSDSGQKGTGSGIRILNTEINNLLSYRIKDQKIRDIRP
jgi:hypothetical protein